MQPFQLNIATWQRLLDSSRARTDVMPFQLSSAYECLKRTYDTIETSRNLIQRSDRLVKLPTK